MQGHQDRSDRNPPASKRNRTINHQQGAPDQDHLRPEREGPPFKSDLTPGGPHDAAADFVPRVAAEQILPEQQVLHADGVRPLRDRDLRPWHLDRHRGGGVVQEPVRGGGQVLLILAGRSEPGMLEKTMK